jgi:hypothetical protein
MKKNIGSTDKIIRILVAALIGILLITNVISGTVGIVLVVVAAILLLTSFINFCPLYAIFGIKTCKTN